MEGCFKSLVNKRKLLTQCKDMSFYGAKSFNVAYLVVNVDTNFIVGTYKKISSPIKG